MHNMIVKCNKTSNEIEDEKWLCMLEKRATIEKKLLLEETWGYSDGGFSLNETTAASTWTHETQSDWFSIPITKSSGPTTPAVLSIDIFSCFYG